MFSSFSGDFGFKIDKTLNNCALFIMLCMLLPILINDGQISRLCKDFWAAEKSQISAARKVGQFQMWNKSLLSTDKSCAVPFRFQQVAQTAQEALRIPKSHVDLYFLTQLISPNLFALQRGFRVRAIDRGSGRAASMFKGHGPELEVCGWRVHCRQGFGESGNSSLFQGDNLGL